MTTLRFPLSRIEGHARVEMEVQDGQVVTAQFQAIEMRGFRYFMLGTPAEQMPVIVPRICGVCSTAHHVASVKALEDVFEVTPPKLASDIRELLLLRQLTWFRNNKDVKFFTVNEYLSKQELYLEIIHYVKERLNI